MTVGEWAARLGTWFPASFAESWDNTGLLLGDPDTPVKRLMTCLTITPATAAEAIREKVDLIVSHHPIFFKPIRRLTRGGEHRDLYDLARAGIAVHSPHTAYDSAADGINAQIAERLGLIEVQSLRPVAPIPQLKIAVYTPHQDLDAVMNALFEVGGGVIGRYRECSFRWEGTGTFFGDESTQPTVGMKGRREEANESRLEVMLPRENLSAALAAIRKAHSYEEPAIDVYALEPAELPPREGEKKPPARAGVGRIGNLPKPMSLAKLAKRISTLLPGARREGTGDPDRMIGRVAIGCGSAGELLHDAARLHADLFLTGEARFHDLLAAERQGLSLLLAGHYATERFALETLAARLGTEDPSLTVWCSRDERDPLVALA